MNRLPPHSKEAERGVIGAILRDPDSLFDVQAILQAESFYFDAHQKIFCACESLVASGKPIDVELLWEEITRRKQGKDIGGAVYIGELFSAMPTGANAIYHAKIVHDRWMRRLAIHAANELLANAHEPAESGDDLIAKAQQSLFDISSKDRASANVSDIKTLLRDAINRMDARSQHDNVISGVTSGLMDLDEMTGGFKPSQLVVLGARPSAGKTSLGLGIALSAAMSSTPTLMFSLEMSKEEIADRVITWQTGVPVRRLHRPSTMSASDLEGVVSATSEYGIGRFPLYIEDAPDVTVTKIASIIRREVRRRNIGLVVIDYLTLINAENRKDSRYLQVGEITKRLKWTARQCKIPIVLLAQVGREAEKRGKDERPKLSDLRESGNIEQDADIVLFIHHMTDDKANNFAPCEIIVAKQRNGPTGPVSVVYQREAMRFVPSAPMYS